jgi:hypothetical protein
VKNERRLHLLASRYVGLDSASQGARQTWARSIGHVRRGSSVCTEGAVTCNRLQITATTDPTCSYRQREYLGSYIAFNMKSAHCILGNDFDQNERGSNFLDGVARALDSHVTLDFLTNESCFRGSRVTKSRHLLREFLDMVEEYSRSDPNTTKKNKNHYNTN